MFQKDNQETDELSMPVCNVHCLLDTYFIVFCKPSLKDFYSSLLSSTLINLLIIVLVDRPRAWLFSASEHDVSSAVFTQNHLSLSVFLRSAMCPSFTVT